MSTFYEIPSLSYIIMQAEDTLQPLHRQVHFLYSIYICTQRIGPEIGKVTYNINHAMTEMLFN